MTTPFIGEIRIFAGTFAPQGWFFCQGQLLNISDYQPLYAVIGNIYGDDNRTTFSLPNLQAYAPIGQGNGPGLSPRMLGQPDGSPTVVVYESNMPSHTHAAQGTNATGTSSDPTGRIWAKVVSSPQLQPYGQTVAAQPVIMSGALNPAGNSQAHPNMQPYLGVNFIIAWDGDFPIRQ
jgi:microcystin-dependent protein